MILYVYKVVIGLVINPGLTIEYDPRRKIRVTPKTSTRNATGWIRVARDSSFFCQGPKLFNSLPLQLRELENIATPTKNDVTCFKTKLDNHLRTIPDLPGSLSNSLL